jgi:glycosyltransferase involved in cell wall biosynthesis
MTAPKKVLIITYYWPPSGGAGVQRWVKFAKYLPEYGWEPLILTVDPEFAAYPVTDRSQVSEIPSSLKVLTTKATDYFTFYKKDKTKIPSAGFASNTDNSLKGKLMRFIRGNFFIPDPRKGWNRYALQKARELINQHKIENVITTSPPHSTQLIGLKLKKEFPSIKWMADLRDPWTDIYYYNQFYPTLVSKLIDGSYEKEVLRKADRIIVVGESLKQIFSGKVPGADRKISVITNGYDEADFIGEEPEKPSVFTITYVGTLSDIYPIGGFLDALDMFRSEGRRFILQFIGLVSERQKKLLKSKLSDQELVLVPYVDHSESIRYMRGSSVLLLIIPDHSSNKSIITGKLFEYLASFRPVICLGPVDGDPASILKETGHGITTDYTDTKTIGDQLKKLISQNDQPMNQISVFSRSTLTGKLAEVLKS